MESLEADIAAISQISILPSLLEVVCRATGMGFAAVAKVTEDKWVACGVHDEILFGIKPGGELQIETTICNEIRRSHEAVIIDHVEKDEIFCRHPTPAMYGFQSYISVPIIRKNGNFFGTLCAIDPKPARLNNPQIIGMFKLFADLIAFHLQAIEDLISSQTKLLEERKTAELREQFIAILGHDLRNPIGAISNSAQVLQVITSDEDILRLAGIIKNSSYRMQGLIENILDFARGRLGEGIIINRKIISDIENVLTVVITELHAVWPGRIIETQFDLSIPVNCDSSRIAQLFSNLLSNALSYGKMEEPVMVVAISSAESFTLSVTNKGNEIPAKEMAHLFTAFYRSEVKPGQQGLGLGLFISAEIARAHGGDIRVESSSEKTSFTLQIPAF
ncbi:MAG: GAF domain-containing sensor histidine kinase [Chitinophagaceae bacterium]